MVPVSDALEGVWLVFILTLSPVVKRVPKPPEVAVTVVKSPAAAVVFPIVVLSMVPPLIATVVKVLVPDAVKSVTVAAAAVVAPIVVLSMAPALMSTVARVAVPDVDIELKAPVPSVVAPMFVPSISPPLISTVAKVAVPVALKVVN